MLRRLLPVLTLLLWAGPAGWAGESASEAAAPQARKPRKTTFASVFKDRKENPILLVEYPWQVHAKPSIEVRLATGKDETAPGDPPMLFRSTRMKGKVAAQVYNCLDRAADAGTSKSLKDGQTEFEIVGRTNALEKPAVSVTARTKNEEGDWEPVGTALPLLDCWAINKGLLYIDLPPEAFAEAGTLHVWFLRDDTVLWKQAVAWPGYGK